MQLKAPRGTKDALPSDIEKWYFAENLFKRIAHRYDFREIRTPAFEFTSLFERGVGDTSDIVSKEMYTFLDKGDRSITLKAEGTAPVVRSFIENRLFAGPLPVKLCYITPVFRYEKPQAGRLRQHHQLGIESFGSSEPVADAEVIAIANDLLTEAGISNFELRLNSIGCADCRPGYNAVLKEYLNRPEMDLCEDCLKRRDKNPLRVLDCKNPNCQAQFTDVPLISDSLCENCVTHFTGLKDLLDEMEISYTLDPRMVRGLDYYTRTAFEFVSSALGAVATVCGGGRYDKLVEELGGKPMPAVGFGMGIERFILLMSASSEKEILPQPIDLMIIEAPGIEKKKVLKIASALRKQGLCITLDYMNRSFKAQMKYLNKCNARYFMVVGDDEIEKNLFLVKGVRDNSEKEMNLSEIPSLF